MTDLHHLNDSCNKCWFKRKKRGSMTTTRSIKIDLLFNLYQIVFLFTSTPSGILTFAITSLIISVSCPLLNEYFVVLYLLFNILMWTISHFLSLIQQGVHQDCCQRCWVIPWILAVIKILHYHDCVPVYLHLH